MNMTPMYKKTFSNIEIKIWSYPKNILKCVLKGLTCNLNTQNKVIDVVGFRHFYYEDYGGCNCNDKLEDICFKYSIATHRQDTLYIPIEVVNCATNCHRVYLSELRSIPIVCKNRYPHAINIISERNGSLSCLLRLPMDSSNTGLKRSLTEKCYEAEDLQLCYEKIIKHLTRNRSPDNKCTNKNRCGLDTNLIIDICLKYNVSSEKIVSLLKELECDMKIRSNLGMGERIIPKKYKVNNQECIPRKVCGRCKERGRYDCDCVQLTNLPIRTFKIVRTPSPQYCCSSYSQDNDDNGPRFPTPEIVAHSIPNKGSILLNRDPPDGNINTSTPVDHHSKYSEDIQEIKGTLNNIMKMINSDDKADCMSFQTSTSDFNDVASDANRQFNSEEIINSIIQRISKYKCESIEPAEVRKMLFEKGPSTKVITCYDEDRASYQNLQINSPVPQSITTICNTDDAYLVPILDAYDRHVPLSQSPLPTPLCPVDRETQNKAIRNALESAGLPVDLSDYISKLTPTEFNDGVTNIYYYVNNDTGEVTIKSIAKKPQITKEPEYVVEQQITPNVSDVEDNQPSSYSHIIVDINFHPDDENLNDYDENVNELIAVPPTSQRHANATEEHVPSQIGSNRSDKAVEFLSEQARPIRDSSKPLHLSTLKSSQIINSIPEHDFSIRDSQAPFPSGSIRTSKAAETIPEQVVSIRDYQAPFPSGSIRTSKAADTIPEQVVSIRDSQTPFPSGSIRTSKAADTIPEQVVSIRDYQAPFPSGSIRTSKAADTIPEQVVSIRDSQTPFPSGSMKTSKAAGSMTEQTVSMRNAKTPILSGSMKTSKAAESIPEQVVSIRDSQTPFQSGSMKTSKAAGSMTEQTVSMRNAKTPILSGSMKTSKAAESIPEQVVSIRDSQTPFPSGSMKTSKAAGSMTEQTVSMRNAKTPILLGSMKTSKAAESIPEQVVSIRDSQTPFPPGSMKTSKAAGSMTEQTVSMRNAKTPILSGSMKTSKAAESIPDQIVSMRLSNGTIPSGSMLSSKAADQIISQYELNEKITGSVKNDENFDELSSVKNSIGPDISGNIRYSNTPDSVPEQNGSIKNSKKIGILPVPLRPIISIRENDIQPGESMNGIKEDVKDAEPLRMSKGTEVSFEETLMQPLEEKELLPELPLPARKSKPSEPPVRISSKRNSKQSDKAVENTKSTRYSNPSGSTRNSRPFEQFQKQAGSFKNSETSRQPQEQPKSLPSWKQVDQLAEKTGSMRNSTLAEQNPGQDSSSRNSKGSGRLTEQPSSGKSSLPDEQLQEQNGSLRHFNPLEKLHEETEYLRNSKPSERLQEFSGHIKSSMTGEQLTEQIEYNNRSIQSTPIHEQTEYMRNSKINDPLPEKLESLGNYQALATISEESEPSAVTTEIVPVLKDGTSLKYSNAVEHAQENVESTIYSQID